MTADRFKVLEPIGAGAAGNDAVRTPPTMRKPSEICAMTFDDSDMILGDRLLAEGQPLTILGEGGLGKSKLLLQLIACQLFGAPFLGIPTHGTPRKWVIFQTENSTRRLKYDLDQLRGWLGPESWGPLDDGLYIHTLETDEDGDMCLEERASEISAITEEFGAHVVCFDPLNTFSLRDLNSDSDMRAVCSMITRTAKKGDPKRAIVVLHHALTGRAGAQKAVGYDRSSFGRNSKVLFNWSRGQINIASGTPDSNDTLVLACGKTNNGVPFKPFAVKRNAVGFYEVDHSFDFEEWGEQVSGTKGKKKPFTPDQVADILGVQYLTKKELIALVMKEGKVCQATAYTAVDKAWRQKLISYSKQTKAYGPAE